MKKTLFWILAVVITLASAYYQRKTGPNHPKDVKIILNEEPVKFKLIRSGDSNEDLAIEIPLIDENFRAELNYRRFPLNEEFTKVDFKPEGEMLIAHLPKQPPAGKLEYYVSFYDEENSITEQTVHVVTRFKGTVPNWAIIPHVIFIFIAMLLSNIAGIFAIAKDSKHVFYGNLTLILLLIAGMVFGPIVQKFAFGEFWTGIPFGWDLTDNKTLIAVIFWIVAVISNRKNPKYRYTIIAAIVMFLIFLIPHSMFGSELDYESGEVVTGIINFFI